MYARTDARFERWSRMYVTLIHSMENNTHIADVAEAILTMLLPLDSIFILLTKLLTRTTYHIGEETWLVQLLLLSAVVCNSLHSVPVASLQREDWKVLCNSLHKVTTKGMMTEALHRVYPFRKKHQLQLAAHYQLINTSCSVSVPVMTSPRRTSTPGCLGQPR